jgi:hypothetical protein
MDEVDRFTSDSNISAFADQLRWETVPTRREGIKRLLIKEETRFGAVEERLALVERRLSAGAELIDKQRRLIREIKTNGGDAYNSERTLQILR